jgi:copper transport protein
MEVPIADQGTGTYLVQWRAISADGHPVGGSYAFSVGSPSTAITEVAVETTSGLPLLALSRWLHLVALALTVGPASYLLVRRPVGAPEVAVLRLARISFFGSLLLLVAGAIMLVGQVVAVGGSLSSMLEPDLLLALVASRWGLLWSGRIVVGILLSLCIVASMPSAVEGRIFWPWWALNLCLGGILVGLTALNSHASVSEPVWFSLAADAAHLGSAILWAGSLAAYAIADLPPLLGAKEDGVRAAGLAFSRLSSISVVTMQVMVITGLYSAWIQAKVPSALVATPYGQVLIVKMALVGAAMVLGAYHLFVIRPKLDANAVSGGFWQGPRRTVAVEMTLVAAILLAAGILTAMPPVPSSAVYTPQVGREPDVKLAENAGSTMVWLSLAPDSNPSVLVRLIDLYGNPVEGAQVRVSGRNVQTQAVGGVVAQAQYMGNGTYGAGVTLPSGGEWAIDVTVSVGGREDTASFRIPLPLAGAKELLKMADEAMNRLNTLTGNEELTDGRATVQTHYEFQAPDKMHMVVQGIERLERYAVGNVRYDKVGSGDWTQEPWPAEGGFRWPFYNFHSSADEVVLLGRERVDGVECLVLAFTDVPSGAMYRMWMGASDHLIRQYRMIMPGHYMTVRYYGFNSPLTISPPQ